MDLRRQPVLPERRQKVAWSSSCASVAYWLPTDEPLAGKTLVYMLKHPSREAATANWAAFHDDPEWKQVSAASEANGKLVEKVDSTFLKRTDFSPKL